MANNSPFTDAEWNWLRRWRRGGPEGQPGTTGPAGAAGATGPQGPQGVTGAQGTTGAQGPAGSPGPQGSAGSTGAQGAAGPQGVTGSQGATGAQGAAGATGAQGPQGTTGAQGDSGAQGAAGAQGAQGFQGSAGSTGAQGAAGSTGAQGAAGAQGAQGAQGATGAGVRHGRSKHGGNVDFQFPGAALGATSTLAFNNGVLVYWFMRLPTSVTFDAFGFNVTAGPASNANVRTGIYNADTDYQPTGAALVDVNTTVASGFTGVKTPAIASGGALTAGLYLVAFNCDVNMTLRTWRGFLDAGFVDNGLAASSSFVGGSVASAFGALPTGVPWTATFNSSGDHSVLLRESVP